MSTVRSLRVGYFMETFSFVTCVKNNSVSSIVKNISESRWILLLIFDLSQ